MNHVGTSRDLPGTGHSPGTCMRVTHSTFVATEGSPILQGTHSMWLVHFLQHDSGGTRSQLHGC